MKRMLRMLAAVIVKEVRQTVRDRRMMILLIAAPLVQLVLFGHAVQLDVDRVPTVIVDRDQSAASRGHLRALLADGTLRAVARTQDVIAAERMLETSDAAVVLVVPRGFERDLVRGRGAQVQVLVDGSDPNRANVASSAVATYLAQRSEALIRARAAGRLPMLSTRSRVLFNPQLATAIYMVPGVSAMLLLMITTIVTAMGLARERERGTFEQILVTPVPAGVLILGKILPFAAIGLIDFALALAVGSTVFDMPLRGSMTLLFLATSLYLLVTLGTGLLISTVSSSQQQAFMLGFLFMLPASLLSGIITPVRSMPAWLAPLTFANPLRHYAEILRGALLRGAGLRELVVPLAMLAVIGVVVFAAAAARFRKVAS